MQSGAEQKQTRTIMGRYNDMRPIGGYSKHPAPNIEREAKKAKRSVRLMRPGQIHSDLGLRREINLRYNTLYKPRYGWEYPAYTRFMGVSASDYPQNYPLMYGYGPRSDHYYYGLTPKDVVLARSKKRAIGTTGFQTFGPAAIRDVSESQRFIDTLSAVLYEGYLPTNDDILHFLDRLGSNVYSHLRSSHVSHESAQVMTDILDLIQLLERFIMEYNSDEKFQSFIHHSTLSTQALRFQRLREKRLRESAFGEAAAEESLAPQSAVAPLLKALTKSGEFRDIVMNLAEIIQDYVGYGTGPTMTLNEPPAGILYDYENYDSGYASPQFAYPVYADGGSVVEQMGFEDIPRAIRVHFVDEIEVDQPEAQGFEPLEPIEEAEEYEGLDYPARFAQEQPEVQFTPEEYVMPAVTTKPFYGQGYQKDYISALRKPLDIDIAMQLMEKVKDLMQDITSTPGFSDLMTKIWDTISDLGSVRSKDSSNILYRDANREQMSLDLKAIIEDLAEGYKLDNLIAIVDDFQVALQRDWKLRDFLYDVGLFLKRSLSDPMYVQSADYMVKGADQMTKGRTMLVNNYPDLTNAFLNEITALFGSFRQNHLLKDFSRVFESLQNHLLFDERTGELTLKSNLIKDLRQVYFPILLQSIRYLPLPRIEINDEQYDLAFENIVLSLDEIVPNMVDIKWENEVQISPRPDLPDAYYMNVLNIDIYQIQANLKNVEFAYRKKSFPVFEDEGLADLIIGGNGLSVHVRVAVDPNLWYTTLIPLDIDVTIDYLDLRLHDALHNYMYKLIGFALKKQVKKRICRAVEERIFNFIRNLDSTITAAK